MLTSVFDILFYQLTFIEQYWLPSIGLYTSPELSFHPHGDFFS